MQSLPLKDGTPLRQHIQQMAQNENVDLGLLGLATPLYHQKYAGTFDAESINDSSATKGPTGRSAMS